MHGGVDGNERLTASTAVVLLVLLALEGATLISVTQSLDRPVFGLRRQPLASRCFSNIRLDRKLAHQVTEPDIVPHVRINIDKKYLDRRTGGHEHKIWVSDPLDLIRKHVVLRAGGGD